MNTIIDTFPLWTTAQTLKTSGRGIRANNQILLGIQKLRELILELAVRGKLVTQDPNDEPASILLKKISNEKKRLIKEGKIKKQEVLPEVGEDEKPFELPKKWEWVKLNSIISLLGDGIHGTPNYSDNGEYYFINGNNLTDGSIEIKSNTKRVDEIEFLKHRKEINDTTVFVSINGTIGNVAFYNGEKVILGKSACYFNMISKAMKDYIKMIINSSYFISYAFENATGTTINNVSLKTMRSFNIPLPSLSEQNRIVAKVDELFAICDTLKERINHAQTTQNLLALGAAIFNR